jgi:hypothetical protein
MDPPEIVALVLARQRHEAALECTKAVLQTRKVDRTESMAFVDATNGLHNGSTYINRLMGN